MPQFPGHWQPSTLTGSRILKAGNEVFTVPEDADLKTVYSTIGKVHHVRIEREVFVLSAKGMLVETADQRRSRAAPANWSAIAADNARP